MEPIAKLQGDTSSPNLETKENVAEEKQVIAEVEGKRAKGELRFSLSTERRYDEKSISEEELKKKRDRLMHRRGTQYEYLIDGPGEMTKVKVDDNFKPDADVLPKNEIPTLSKQKLLEVEKQKLKEEPKQAEKEPEINEMKLEVADAKIE